MYFAEKRKMSWLNKAPATPVVSVMWSRLLSPDHRTTIYYPEQTALYVMTMVTVPIPS